jgi:uncharacterized protein YdhG (YjbR/CyaY superfamily)
MKDNISFIIHTSTDKEGLTNIPQSCGIHKTKKDAKKAMMNQASNDLSKGKYYFYRLIEQRTITHEVYPSIQTSE